VLTLAEAQDNALVMKWEPTRAAGLARLGDFLPHAGRAYASGRNVDHGPDDRSNVSALSPWIRRRLITEEEVIAAVLKRHSFSAAEKFVQEVVWRTYWKGWLEMRPSVLWRFDADRLALKARLEDDGQLNRRFQAAIEGRSGIDCFDVWARELIEFGWLHNHSRMWFASIWIFTLGLPWQLGADFFYKHLLDADPASNTLSWRWVAGLHTQGKHYLARAENIERNTLGRFNPVGQLNERAEPLYEDGLMPPASPIPAPQIVKSSKVGLLLTEEDLHPESWNLNAKVVAIAALPTQHVGLAESPAMHFGEGAIADACSRAAAHFGVEAQQLQPTAVADWAKHAGVDEIVTGYAPTGLVARALDGLASDLAKQGIGLTQLRRDWDSKAWPAATAGFFKVKAKIPALISHLV
jgi:deoxyribodipyrimidine photo-lyase